jgi:hypothetical protein
MVCALPPPQNCVLGDFLTPESVKDTFSRNVCNKLPLEATNIPEYDRSQLFVLFKNSENFLPASVDQKKT